ncbi:MAG: phosphohistidine phosphatase [Myxococcota bacterium]|jgi:phosphohistidine phosphatase
MKVIFVRHGERRKGESDPELTSWGRRMSTETGHWIQAQGLTPDQVIVTPTMRTRQTVEEILLVFSAPIPIREAGLPELLEDWDALLETIPEKGVALLVGHHPTMDMLRRELGPLPVSVPRGHFASAVVLEADGGSWRCAASWPGRPA